MKSELASAEPHSLAQPAAPDRCTAHGEWSAVRRR
jgi:hypothetical protein